MSFVKLDTGILNSTLWVERGPRDVFITALLMAQPREILEPMPQLRAGDNCIEETGFVVPPGWYGFVSASGPGIVRMAMAEPEEGLKALATLGEPDPESRSHDFDGRRLVRVDGGYVVLNYMAYRDKDATSADRSKRWRQRQKERHETTQRHAVSDTPQRVIRHQAEAEAEALRAKDSPLRGEVGTKRADPAAKPIVNGHKAPPPTDPDNGATDAAPPAKRCPVSEIVALYHEKLPMCPRVEKITDTRKGYIRQRWLDDLPTMEAWGNYFTDVAASKFLTGKAESRDGKPPFVADLEWLTRPGNFAKVAEGKYHR